jgi:hypothetical protein
MSKNFTDQDFIDEIDLFYKDGVVNPTKPFPYHVNSMAETLLKRKGKLSQKNAGIVAGAMLTTVGLLFVTSIPAISFDIRVGGNGGLPMAIIMFFVALLLLGISVFFGDYADDKKHSNNLIRLLTQSENFRTSFKGWLNDRYSFAGGYLTDEAIFDAFTYVTFKVGENYYSTMFDNNAFEVTSVRDASPKEATAYDELKFGAQSDSFNEVRFNDKVKDKLEVIYL